MTSNMSRRRALVLLLVAAVDAGCSRSPVPNRKAVIPVSGKLLASGKPAAGAVVCFHPVNDPGPRALRSNAKVEQDGAFVVTTYAKGDGVPEGEYVVTVYWADLTKGPPKGDDEDLTDLPPDLLQGRFARRETSKLRAKITGESVMLAPVDLQSEEVAKAREYSFPVQPL
jgi:hypothetical protein